MCDKLPRSSHTTHHTQLILHHSFCTLILHNSSRPTHLTQLITHHSSYTIHLALSSHTTHLTPLITHHSPLISFTFIVQYFSVLFSISLYFSLLALTSLTCGVIQSFYLSGFSLGSHAFAIWGLCLCWSNFLHLSLFMIFCKVIEPLFGWQSPFLV